MKFLGLTIGHNGINIYPTKTHIIQKFETKRMVRDVQSLIGLVKFFRRFEKNNSRRSKALTYLTKKERRMKSWTKELEKTFQDRKSSIIDLSILASPH